MKSLIKKIILILIGSIPGIVLIYKNNIECAKIYFIIYAIFVLLILLLTRKQKRVLFISSTGGHLEELFQLKPLMDKYNFYFVTEINDTNKNLKDKYPNRIGYLAYGTRKNIIKYVFIFGFNILKSLYIYFKIKPKVIVTTGTHTAVPMCYIGKIFGSKIIFIETFANRETKTLAGTIVYPIADLFVVQWKEMLKVYPKAVYLGGVY